MNKNIIKIIYIGIVILLMILLGISVRQCSHKTDKYETNIKALNDSIRYYKSKSGNSVAQTSAFVVDNSKEIKELKEELYNALKEMKIQNSTIAAMQFSGEVDNGAKDTIYEIKHDTIQNGFIKDFSFSDKYRELNGKVTYIPDTLAVDITSDKIFFDYTVAIDKKNQVKIMSNNPYVKYNEISGFTITKQKQKKFGIGPQVGYGYNFNGNKFAPYIGIGISYNLITF